MAEFPEYLTEQTEEIIRQRMLGNLPTDIDKSEGEMAWDVVTPTAIELAVASLWAQDVLRFGFATTAASDISGSRSEYLDLRCGEQGITRQPATKATGQVKFIGAVGTVVPSGTVLTTTADLASSTPSIEFVTTSEVIIGSNGEGFVNVEAAEKGIGGKVIAGAINILTTPVSGIKYVINPEATSGGSDIEDDQSLLSRYLVKVRNPAVSANKSQYIQWAMEIPGVGGVYVETRWDGPDTIKLHIIDSNKQPASTEVVNQVQEYIDPLRGQGEGKAPIDHFVTVVAAKAITVNVVVTISRKADYPLQGLKSVFESSAIEYFKSITYGEDPIVRITRIGNLLLDVPGITDYSNLSINGNITNINVAAGEVAVLGMVTMNEQ